MPELSPARLGVAVLSAVRHAQGYVDVLRGLPGVEVVVVAEEAGAPAWAHEAARALAERCGAALTDDPASALRRPDVHLALVCSEPVRHARLGRLALAAGHHVLLDKPMATTLRDADEIARAALAAPGRFSVIHRLHSPAIRRARAAIDAGAVGLVRSVDIEWLASDGLSGTSVERPELVTDPALSGGGELQNFLGYPVGYLRHLTGAEVEEVFAETATLTFPEHRRGGVEDFGMLSLRLEHGILATVSVGRVRQAPGPGPGTSTLRVIGSHGHLWLDEDDGRIEQWTPAAMSMAPIGEPAASQAVRAMLDEFVTAIRTGREPLFGARDGWAVAAVVEAAYRSARCGQPARVAPWQGGDGPGQPRRPVEE